MLESWAARQRVTIMSEPIWNHELAFEEYKESQHGRSVMNIDERIKETIALSTSHKLQELQIVAIKQFIRDVIAEVTPERLGEMRGDKYFTKKEWLLHDQAIDEMEAKMKEIGL